jgi:SNF2 family DNA or RNA helicase
MSVVEIPPKTFTTAEHAEASQLYLTEAYESVGPSKLKGVQLYPHQATIVAAMLDLEDKRVIRVDSSCDLTIEQTVLETSAMVLSEPFGTGKTIEILEFIERRPLPRAFPTYANSIVLDTRQLKRHQRRNEPTEMFVTEVTRRFTGPDALIKPNFIVVGSSVLTQWENAIKEFTNRKCLVVGDFYDLKEFDRLYKERKLNAYDIVLIKNGKVTGNFLLPGEDPLNVPDYRGLVSVVGSIIQNSCCSRVWYDDFDTIAIPSGTQAINAMFTVYVSATTKIDTSKKITQKSYSSIIEAFRDLGTPLHLVTRDNILFSNFNVRNISDYTESSTKITKIQGYQYVYDNPDDNYIRLIGAMGEEDAKNIMEMLNGDAIATAADALGIKTTSVADIFQRLLDKKYEKYIHDQDVLELLGKLKPAAEKLRPHAEGKQHSIKKLDVIRGSIVKLKQPAMKYYSSKLVQMLDSMDEEYHALKEQDGLAISRVISNIKEGACQVCTLPLEEFDTFIVRCCGLILCDLCGIKGNQIKNKYDYKTKSYTVFGSCANCKTTIYPQRDLIFVDKNFDMDALLKAKGDEKPEVEEIVEPVVEVVETEVADPEPEIKNPKLKALRDIILGRKPAECKEINIHIPHLLEGRVDIAQPEGLKRKVVVFANFTETLNLVQNFLVEHNILFLRLSGTYAEKASTVAKFVNYGSVLLINSQQHCAGLNIQFMTDLVYFHKITDPNIESQVAGRGQRIGRTSNLRIHYLAYKNEEKLIAH